MNTVDTIKANIFINKNKVNYKFHFLPRKYHSRGVLGRYFFCSNKAIINYDKKTIELYGSKVQITNFEGNIENTNEVLTKNVKQELVEQQIIVLSA